MEWIPAMLLLAAAGLVAGLLSIALFPFARPVVLGRRLGILAIVIGAGSPLFILFVVGNGLNVLAYMILAAPAGLGLIALWLYPRKRKHARGFAVLRANNGKSQGK